MSRKGNSVEAERVYSRDESRLQAEKNFSADA